MTLYNSTKEVDYSELLTVLERRKNSLFLRKMFLELTALKMLYSKNSLPIYSYPRIKSFIRMFNKEYNLNLNIEGINAIMAVDYRTMDTRKLSRNLSEYNKKEG